VTKRRLLVAAAALAAVAAAPLSAFAHPVSTTAVTLQVLENGTVTAVLTMDAGALLTKLEVADGSPDTSPPSRALGDRILDFRGPLSTHVHLSSDVARVGLAVVGALVDDAGNASVTFAGTLPGGARSISWGTDLVYGAYPLAVHIADQEESLRWVQGRESSEPFMIGHARRGGAFSRGIWLGFTHIVPLGLDHILFVIGLFLLNTRLKPLLAQVSAFTVAHSVTLALSLYGVVSLPGHVVEPLIALSVAYVGIENVFTSRLQPWRIVIVFGFGLLHGLGFADALASLQLSRADLLATLLSFNLGVELGQLAVIGCASALLYCLVFAQRATWRPMIVRAASAGVGSMGIVWTIERLFFA
jgi:hydrogenase/urease accessory protein HupE